MVGNQICFAIGATIFLTAAASGPALAHPTKSKSSITATATSQVDSSVENFHAFDDPQHFAAQVVTGITSSQNAEIVAAKTPTPENIKAAEDTKSKLKILLDSGSSKFDQSTTANIAAASGYSQLGDLKTASTRADQAVNLGEAALNSPASPDGSGAPPGQKSKDLADALVARSAIRAQSGDKKAALDDINRALKLNPNDEIALRLSKLISGHQFRDIHVGAIPGTDPAKLNEQLAELRRDLSQINAAVAGRVVNRPAGFSGSVGHTLAAETGLKMGDYEKMYDEASAALVKLPDNPKAYMQRAFAAYMMKRYEQTIKDASKGLELKPKTGSMLSLRAAAYNETGRPKDGLTDAVAAVAASPKDPFAWLQRGLAREKLEAGDGYLGDLKQAAELDPEFGHYYEEALGRRAQGADADAAKSGAASAGKGGSAPDSGIWGRLTGGLDRGGWQPRDLYWLAGFLLLLAILIVVWRRRDEEPG